MRWIQMVRGMWLATLVLAAVGCATARGGKNDKLLEAQYDYSAAIRWGNFEGAWNLVDPKHRKEHPKTDLEFARYQQIQVSGYSELGSSMAPDKQTALREIGINVINKHTMTERSVRYTEAWRYDPVAKTWWLTSDLPDFWAGQ